MPLEDWIQHCKVAQFFYDWQTIIARALALLAAFLTVRATERSTDREIDASQAQIETTVRLERERLSSESETLRRSWLSSFDSKSPERWTPMTASMDWASCRTRQSPQ
jgi:hypothetical protein